MSRRQALLAAVLLTLPLAGCGAEEAPLTETQRIVRTAQELTLEARELVREIAGRADELSVADSEERREQSQERLEDQRDRAEELVDRSRDELPPGIPVRDELEGAGERLAAAAEALLSFADSGDDEELAAARAAIAEAGRRQESAASQLADRPPPELRELIERVRGVAPG